MLLRDPDIRAPLHRWLRSQHIGQADTEILHELKMPRPSARIDIAVVNGELCGFEIKSDVDNLARLIQQKIAFSKIFDRVSVVTTKRHVTTLRRRVPNWWGIILAEDSSPKIEFITFREARPNVRADTACLLYMLTRAELRKLISDEHPINGFSRMLQGDMIRTILHSLPITDIRSRARDILRQRQTISFG